MYSGTHEIEWKSPEKHIFFFTILSNLVFSSYLILLLCSCVGCYTGLDVSKIAPACHVNRVGHSS